MLKQPTNGHVTFHSILEEVDGKPLADRVRKQKKARKANKRKGRRKTECTS